MTPNGAELLDLLIALYTEQEGIKVKYTTEEVHNEH